MNGISWKTVMVGVAACLFLAVVTLPAATVNTATVEAAARKVKLSRGDTDDLVRAFRGAVNAGVPARRLESLVGQALDGEMEGRLLERILVLLTNVVLDDLPLNPMLNKFGEGLAKDVDPRSLVDTLESRALALGKARRVLAAMVSAGRPLSDKELVLTTVAGALERGAGESEVERILGREEVDLKAILLEIEQLR